MAELPYNPVPTVGLTGPATARQNIDGATPEAFGAGVGRAMSQLGQQISVAVDPWVQQEKQARSFSEEEAWQKAQNQIEADARAAQQNLTGDGVGFADSQLKNADAVVLKAFQGLGYKEVPPQYRAKLEASKGGWAQQFAGFELNKRVANQKNSIEGAMNEQLMAVVKDPTANTLEVFQKRTFELIDKSNLPPIEREALKQKATQDYKYFYGLGQAEKDPTHVLAATNQTAGGLIHAIGQKESTNNRDQGKHRGSSAWGQYGFIEDTWRSTALSERGKAAGLDPNPEARKNPANQDIAIGVLIENNKDALRAQGITPTDANVYLAHFMGVGGATKMLKADPNASAAALFPDAAAANPSVFYKSGKPGEDGMTAERRPRTVGEVIALQTRGLGGSVSDPYISTLPPQQQLQLAGQAERNLVQQEAQRRAEDSAARGRYQDQLLMNVFDGKAGEVEIRQAQQSEMISAEQAISMIGMANKRQETQMIAAGTAEKISRGDNFDPFDKEQAKGVNALSDIYRQRGASPQQAADFDRQLYAKTGILPNTAASALRAQVFGGNPQQLMQGLTTAVALMNIARDAGRNSPFASVEQGPELVKAGEWFNHAVNVQGKSPQDAANEWMQVNSPEYKSKYANNRVLIEEYQQDIRKNDPSSTILANVAPRSFYQGSAGVSDVQKNEMVTTFNELRTEHYTQFHNEEQANAFALGQMKNMYGEVDGKVMKWPVTKVYPPMPDGSHQYVFDQAKETIEKFTGRKAETVDLLPVVQADKTTATEFKAGRPAPYQLMYTYKDPVSGQTFTDTLTNPRTGGEAGWMPDASVAMKSQAWADGVAKARLKLDNDKALAIGHERADLARQVEEEKQKQIADELNTRGPFGNTPQAQPSNIREMAPAVPKRAGTVYRGMRVPE